MHIDDEYEQKRDSILLMERYVNLLLVNVLEYRVFRKNLFYSLQKMNAINNFETLLQFLQYKRLGKIFFFMCSNGSF